MLEKRQKIGNAKQFPAAAFKKNSQKDEMLPQFTNVYANVRFRIVEFILSNIV